MRASSSSRAALLALALAAAMSVAPVGAQEHAPLRRPTFHVMAAPPSIARFGDELAARIVVAADDGRVAVLNGAGRAFPGWPVTIRARISGSPVVGDLDGDGMPEIFAATEDARMFRWNDRGDSLHLEAAPKPAIPARFFPPSLGDLDGDGRAELVAVTSTGMVAVWNHDGRLRAGWPRETGALQMSACALAGVDRVPGDEIIVGTTGGTLHVWNALGEELPGFPQQFDVAIRATAGVTFARDGQAYPLASTFDAEGWLRAFDPRGTSAPGWPVETRGVVNAPVAVGDLDGDRVPEIVVSHRGGTLMVVHTDGRLDPKWPREAHAVVKFGPVLADLTGDASPEILVVTDEPAITAFGADGTELPGWPRDLPMVPAGQPAVGDIDGDGRNEVVVAMQDGEFAVYETDGLTVNARHTRGADSLRLWQNLPSRTAYDFALELLIPEDTPPVTLELLDMRGEVAAVLLSGQVVAPGRNVLANPGRTAVPRVPPGEYTARLAAGRDTLTTSFLVPR